MKIKSFVSLLRMRQWLKNLMLFFPPFLSGGILSQDVFSSALFALPAFCLASSAGYIFNDLLDASNDRLHDEKKNRPMATGAVSKNMAICLIVLSVVLAIGLGMQLSRSFMGMLLCYLLVSFLYSLWLKNQPLIDIFCISAGFILRLLAGGEAFDVVVSEWLFLSVFLLSLYLTSGKRLAECNKLGEKASGHRKSLALYPAGYLDGVMVLCGSAVLVTYSMYVLARPSLIYTVPLCAFGLLRYLLVVKSGSSGDPTDALLKDKGLFAVSFLWVVLVSLSVYGPAFSG